MNRDAESQPVGWLPLLAGLVTLLAITFVLSRTAFWVLAAAAIGFALLATRDWLRIRRLISDRAGEGFDTFIGHESVRAADPEILRAVFEEVQEAMVRPGEAFPLRPTDELLGSPLYLDDGDVAFELVPSIARRAGRDLPAADDLRWGEVRTVGDLVAFLDQCPVTSTPGAF